MNIDKKMETPEANAMRHSERDFRGRRAMLGGGLAIAVGAMSSSNFQRVLAGHTKINEPATVEEFFWAEAIGQRFRIANYSFRAEQNDRPRARRARLVLEDVTLWLPKGQDEARPELNRPCAISLLFRGPSRYLLPSGSYRISHPELGNHNLLISQTLEGINQRRKAYEAILN